MHSQSYIEAAFQFICFAPGPFWLALFIAPTHKWAMRVFDVFLFLLSLHFTLLTLPAVPDLLPLIAQPKFAEIHAFLSTPIGTLGSWNHMVLADLWIGRWVAQDSLNHPYPLVLRLIFLPVILFFGPMGLCFYLVYRAAFLRQLWLRQ